MKKEVTVSARTIDEAMEMGAQELGKSLADISFEVLELPKRGLFGIGNRDARVRVYLSETPADTAVSYIEGIIGCMNIDAKVNVLSESDEEIRINITGEKLGTLIGHHGDVIDALQYLTFLAVNRGMDDEADESEGKKSGVRIFLDVEDYRKKREESLTGLAERVAERVLSMGKPVTLEPMNSYERRIVHSVIQEIPGVSTYSIGQDHDRKIIVTIEGQRPAKHSAQNAGRTSSGKNDTASARRSGSRGQPRGNRRPPNREAAAANASSESGEN